MRNGFDLIKGFYSWVFNNQNLPIKSRHIALYMFFVNQNNRNNWTEWFKCNYDLGMIGSVISTKRDYYSTIHDLDEWGLIRYIPGKAKHSLPMISLLTLATKKDDKPVPQSKSVVYHNDTRTDTPYDTPYDTRTDTHSIKPINLNTYKPINLNTCNGEKPLQPNGFAELVNDEFLEGHRNMKAEDYSNSQNTQKQKTATNKIVKLDKTEIIFWPSFEDFWNLYDKKRGDKDKVEKKWKVLNQTEKEAIMAYLPEYIQSQPDKQFRKDPATFLNNKSWNDEIITRNNSLQSIQQPSSAPGAISRIYQKLAASRGAGSHD